MEQPPSADRLDPALRRDLFFGDLAFTRRQLTLHVIFAAVMLVSLTIRVWYDSNHLPIPIPALGLVTSWLIAVPSLLRAVRRGDRAEASVRPEPEVHGRPGWKDLDAMQSQAAADPDLSSDRRLVSERVKTTRSKVVMRVVLGAYLILIATTSVVFVRVSATEVRAWFHPAPSPTVELVDVILTPWSADFHGAITVDVTGGHVTQIAPYDLQRSSRVPKFRAFEAIGKFLVAGGAIDFSQPGWLDRFKASWLRPIDIGTSGDFLVVDVDPRSHDIRPDQIAAAVVGGKYYSRKDIQTKGR